MSQDNQAPIREQLMLAIRSHQNASDLMDMAVTELLGINRTDGMCLDIVDQHGTMTSGQLAREIGLSTGAVTSVVDRLEEAGYLRRVRDPHDRRRVMLEVTDATREISGMIYGPMSELGRALMGTMSEAETRLVLRFLRTSAIMSREMAALLREHVPPGKTGFPERLQRARAFSPDQKGLARRLIGELPVKRED